MEGLKAYREAGKNLTENLKLPYFPLAVKFIESRKELSEKTRRPSSMNVRVTMCQGLAMSRRIGWTLGLTSEDMVCTPNLIAYGFTELKDEKSFIEAFRTMNYYETDEIAKKVVSEMPRLNTGKYTGIIISPLAWTKVEPDLAIVYCNSAQAMRLIQATVYKTGEKINTPISALSASCIEGVLRTFLTKKPGLVIPGAGDRAFGTTQDHELIFTTPKELIRGTVEALRKAGYEKGIRYPMPTNITEPLVIPDAWKILDRALDRKSS